MSEVFGDDFPDVHATVLNDAELAARRQVEAANSALLALIGRTRVVRERAVRAEREVVRLDAQLSELHTTGARLGIQCLPVDDTGDAMLCDAEHAVSDTPPVCAACHHVRVQQLQARVAELERSLRELAPAPVFRHLYRPGQAGVGTECGRPWTTKEHEHTRGRALPVCWECVRAVLDKQEERNMTLRREKAHLEDRLRDRVRQLDQAEVKANAIAAEARGDRQARDQLVQAVRVAIREAVPDA